MLIATVPLIVLIIGLILFLLPAPSSNTKITRIGEILFFCGVLICTWVAAGHVVRL